VIYDAVYDHLLTRLDPEAAHTMAARLLRTATADSRARAALRRFSLPGDHVLDVHALGRTFPSPLGVAAGLDKNADWFEALGAIGFGFVEVGTVTPRAQSGNQKPRIARILADRALVNAMGFPNEGGPAAAGRLAASGGAVILGANLGKNRDTPVERAADDYREVARQLAPHADYVVLNVSSPNTPGLRALEAVSALEPLIAAVQEELPAALPLLVKISPDLADEDVDAVAALALRAGLAGVIATNTTVDRGVLSSAGVAAVASFQGGGVSGPPLALRSLKVLQRLAAALRGSDKIVISVGGVSSADDVWTRILAGATLVQAYTGFIYGGPGWPCSINRELARRVRAVGASSIGELIGSAGSRATLGV
jgi:dihydroorotate dehydrogenase